MHTHLTICNNKLLSSKHTQEEYSLHSSPPRMILGWGPEDTWKSRDTLQGVLWGNLDWERASQDHPGIGIHWWACNETWEHLGMSWYLWVWVPTSLRNHSFCPLHSSLPHSLPPSLPPSLPRYLCMSSSFFNTIYTYMQADLLVYSWGHFWKPTLSSLSHFSIKFFLPCASTGLHSPNDSCLFSLL